MEKEKRNNNGGLIALIIVLFLLVLGLGGYIVYDKVLSSTNDKKDELSNEFTNANEVDSALLNSLYDILGINVKNGDCLNFFVSNNNYKSNSLNIFTLYASHHHIDITNDHTDEEGS